MISNPDRVATLRSRSLVGPSSDGASGWMIDFDRDFAEEVMTLLGVNTDFMAPEVVEARVTRFLAAHFFRSFSLQDGATVSLEDVRRVVKGKDR